MGGGEKPIPAEPDLGAEDVIPLDELAGLGAEPPAAPELAPRAPVSGRTTPFEQGRDVSDVNSKEMRSIAAETDIANLAGREKFKRQKIAALEQAPGNAEGGSVALLNKMRDEADAIRSRIEFLKSGKKPEPVTVPPEPAVAAIPESAKLPVSEVPSSDQPLTLEELARVAQGERSSVATPAEQKKATAASSKQVPSGKDVPSLVEKLKSYASGRKELSLSNIRKVGGVGEVKAQKVMDELEKLGVVSPEDEKSARPNIRQVLGTPPPPAQAAPAQAAPAAAPAAQ